MGFQRKIIFLLATALLSGCSSPARRFQQHINYLASDRLEGRGLGSHGLDLAADYIAREFRTAGLEPGGDDGTYFQKFPITYHRELSSESRLAIAGDSKPRREGLDFMPFDFSSSGKFSGNIVFCGFGIVANEKDHDDFKGVELQGKVALIFDGEPKSWSEANGGVPTRFSSLRDKIYNAKDHDAAAILVVNLAPEPSERDQLASFSPETADDYGTPAMQITRELATEILSRGGAGDIAEVEKTIVAGTSKSAALTNVTATGETVFKKKTTTARNVIGVRPGRGSHADEWIVIGAHYDHLGIRKPMMRKFVNGRLVKEDLPSQIHNGADDNASGVAGVIEIARMFKNAPVERGIMFIAFTGEEAGLLGSKHFVEHPTIPLDQTVAMLNMDMIGRLTRATPRAESASTHESPSAPKENPHAEANPHAENNPHAAGGAASVPNNPSEANPHATPSQTPAPEVFGLSNGDGRVQVFGTDCGTNFHDLVMRDARTLGLTIAVGVDEGGRSDHASFLRKQIPSMHFFSGNHPDYHQPSDDSWKINAEGGERIAELVFHVAEDLDVQPDRPKFVVVKRDRQTPAGGVTSFRVVMGLTPNYAADGQEGMGVDGVSPQGPADLAGMKAGDRIISIGGKKVANVYDYMAATRRNNPGDVVEVSILREGKPLALRVTLSGTR